MLRTFSNNDEEVMLRLINCSDGSVDLAVVDMAGEPRIGGFLLNVSVENGVTLYPGVEPDFGFPLDDDDVICTEAE